MQGVSESLIKMWVLKMLSKYIRIEMFFYVWVFFKFLKFNKKKINASNIIMSIYF